MPNSLDTNVTVAQTALDDSNDRLAGLLSTDVTTRSAGELMKALTKEQGVSSFAQGSMNKIKDEAKATTGYGR